MISTLLIAAFFVLVILGLVIAGTMAVAKSEDEINDKWRE